VLKYSESYTPETIEKMAAVYTNAVKELGLEKADSCERDRLALYILSIGKSLENANRLLDRAVRMYQRGAPFLGYRPGIGDALKNQFRSCRSRDAAVRREHASGHPLSRRTTFATRKSRLEGRPSSAEA
jgi:hypothetical protein